MKKFILSVCSLLLGIGVASAQDEAIYTLTFNKDNNQTAVTNYTSTWNCISNGATWEISNMNNNGNGGGEENSQENQRWQFVRCGRKTVASTASIRTAFYTEGTVNKIVITGSLNQANNKEDYNGMTRAYVSVNEEDLPTSAPQNLGYRESAESYPAKIDIDPALFKGAKGDPINITIDVENSQPFLMYNIVFEMGDQITGGNGMLQIDKVEYFGEALADLLDPEVSFPQDAYTYTLGDEENPFVAPKVSTVSDGPVVYNSSNSSVATVNYLTGEVTIVGAGETVITANVSATDQYRAGSASYTLTVVDPTIVYASPLGEDFTFENVEGENYPWTHDARYGLKGSAYVSGATVACEGIAISPVIDLADHEDATLNFLQAFNQYKVDGQLIDVADFEGYAYLLVREVAEDGASDWTVVENGITAPAMFSWTYYPNEEVTLADTHGKKIQFGFKYVSTEDCAGTWEIKDIKVTAQTCTGVANIATDDTATPVYYNLQGVRVANPDHGLYIEVKGNQTRKILK